MRVLILYATTEGQTRKICRFIADELRSLGHVPVLHDLTDDPVTPEGFEAAIVAASVHIGKYQTAAMQYIKSHAEKLNTMPSAFLSVSLTAAGDDRESWDDLEKITDHFLRYVGWQPTEVKQVAGALLYTQYDFFKKYIMRMIAKKSGGSTDTKRDAEYTDWEDLRSFVQKFTKASSSIPA